MKNKATLFLKKMMSLLGSVAKAKPLAIKNKTSAFKARLLVLSFMKSRKFLVGSISNKIHNLLNHLNEEESEDEEDGNHQSKAIALYDAKANNYSGASSSTNLEENMDDHATSSGYCYYDEDEDDDKYPDLRHFLFDEEEFDDPGGSIIDIVKNSKEDRENFRLEDEIDHAADLFIKRFHKQVRLQKLESFKRYQEMLERSV